MVLGCGVEGLEKSYCCRSVIQALQNKVIRSKLDVSKVVKGSLG